MAKLKYAAGTRQAQNTEPDVRSYYNFRGLFTKDEPGLIPQDPESPKGVNASAIQNVICKDGTIRPVGGYSKESDTGENVTFVSSTATNFTGGKSFTLLDGTNRRVLFGNNGIIYSYNPVMKRYEVLLDDSASITSPSNYSSAIYSNIVADLEIRDEIFFSASPDGPYYWWNNAQSDLVDRGPNSIYVTDVSRFGIGSGFIGEGGSTTVILEGTTYTYTGINTYLNALTGVTPNPLNIDHTNGSMVMQTPASNGGTLSSALNGSPDIFFTYKGRLGLASTIRSNLILSEVGGPFDYLNFGIGGAVAMNLGDGGGSTQAVIAVKDYFIVFKKDALLACQITQESATTEYERIGSIVYRENIGAIHKTAVCGGENEVYFISRDKLFKRIKGLNDGTTMPTCETVNDQIDNFLKGFEFDQCRLQYFDKSVYITCREGDTNDTLIEYDTDKDTYYVHKKSLTMMMIHNNLLHLSTANNLQTYTMTNGFDGVFDDDEGAVASLWKSPRLRFTDVFTMKAMTMFMVHLRLSPATTVNCQIDFNDGYLYSANFDIVGSGVTTTSALDTRALETENSVDNYLTEDGAGILVLEDETSTTTNRSYIISDAPLYGYGNNRFGIEPYGARNQAVNDDGLLDAIVYFPLPPKYKPNDVTVTFSADDVGQNYSILEFAFEQTPLLGVPKKRMISKNTTN